MASRVLHSVDEPASYKMSDGELAALSAEERDQVWAEHLTYRAAQRRTMHETATFDTHVQFLYAVQDLYLEQQHLRLHLFAWRGSAARDAISPRRQQN